MLSFDLAVSQRAEVSILHFKLKSSLTKQTDSDSITWLQKLLKKW